MARIEIQGVSYPAPTKFTNREIALIQDITGVYPKRWLESFTDGDVKMQVAVAMIVLTHAGQTPDIEKLWDLEPGFMVAVLEEGDEGYEGPPAEAAAEAAPKPTLSAIPSDTLARSGTQG